MSKDVKAKGELITKMRNFRLFAKAFPGQERYQLGKEKGESKKNLGFLPDTYFMTLVVNLLLIVAVLVYFQSTRSMGEEFFIRKNVSGILNRLYADTDHGILPMQPYDEITSTKTFASFMN